jgi:hypothetical protein
MNPRNFNYQADIVAAFISGFVFALALSMLFWEITR